VKIDQCSYAVLQILEIWQIFLHKVAGNESEQVGVQADDSIIFVLEIVDHFLGLLLSKVRHTLDTCLNHFFKEEVSHECVVVT
jgi:hypothetical protein